MAREITQRELRNDSGEVMRGLDAGHAFIVTRNGVPVGELTPIAPSPFVTRAKLEVVMAHAPAIDDRRFREDVDAFVDQAVEPRA